MPELPTQNEHSAADEIKELERLLAEKKKALAERGVENPDVKEAFREVFKEKYLELAPPSTGSTSSPQASPLPAGKVSDDTVKKGDELKQKKREEQLAALIDISFEKGVVEAVNLARAMTPWLLDELHDRLADEYFEKLVEAQKVKEL